MELIAVVMKSPTSAQRFESAKSLLNFGFANYTLLDIQPDAAIPPVEVSLGTLDQVQPILGQGSRILVDRNELNEVTTELRLTDNVEAPVEQGQKLGEMVVSVGGQERQVIPLVADQAVERLTLPGIFAKFVKQLFMAGMPILQKAEKLYVQNLRFAATCALTDKGLCCIIHTNIWNKKIKQLAVMTTHETKFF